MVIRSFAVIMVRFNLCLYADHRPVFDLALCSFVYQCCQIRLSTPCHNAITVTPTYDTISCCFFNAFGPVTYINLKTLFGFQPGTSHCVLDTVISWGRLPSILHPLPSSSPFIQNSSSTLLTGVNSLIAWP